MYAKVQIIKCSTIQNIIVKSGSFEWLEVRDLTLREPMH